MAMVNVEKGKSILDCPTCSDEYAGCAYYEYGRCIYNIATIQQRISRACYEEERQAYFDAKADYEQGLL